MRKTEYVESYLDAWSRRDSKGVVDHLSTNGTYRDIPENSQSSPEELIVHLEQFFAEYRYHYELVGEVQKSANTIAFQYRMFVYKNKRKRAKNAAYHGAEFITLNGESAMVITDYYDIPMKCYIFYHKSPISSILLYIFTIQHFTSIPRLMFVSKRDQIYNIFQKSL